MDVESKVRAQVVDGGAQEGNQPAGIGKERNKKQDEIKHQKAGKDARAFFMVGAPKEKEQKRRANLPVIK